jgi:uncharacterized RDD family membrane protein YckC
MEENEEEPVDFFPERDVLGVPKQKIESVSSRESNDTLVDPSSLSLANNWDRFLAGAIDILLLSFILSIIDSYFFDIQLSEKNTDKSIINFVIINLYYGLVVSSAWQATIGKKVIGLKIVHESGNNISFLRAIWRYYASNISVIVLFLGYISIFNDKNKQAWHDMWAGTFVVTDISDSTEESRKPGSKRTLAYFIVTALLVGQILIYVNSHYYQEAKVQKQQTTDIKDEVSSNKFKNEVVTSLGSAKPAEFDFIYTDTTSGFQILVKKGLRFISPRGIFLAISEDSSLNLIATSGQYEKEITEGTLFETYTSKFPGKYKFSNIKFLPNNDELKIEQAEVATTQNNVVLYGTIRVYRKGVKYYTVWVLYDSKVHKDSNNQLTQQLFNSFKILSNEEMHLN